MKLAWLTDIHLNFLKAEGRREFAQSVVQQSPDAVLISGDIAESPVVGDHLWHLAEVVRRPIYFVLGNHDFYRGSIGETRQRVEKLADESDFLVYLNASEVVELTPNTVLVGHDGWGDARLGNYETSDILLNDFFLIDELKTGSTDPTDMDRTLLKERLQALGDEAADHFRRVLPKALATHGRVVAVTHVPPFREAAWHQGRYSDAAWLPFFACKAVGDCMIEVMKGHPDRELLVLCGHTHGGGRSQVLDNLLVLTGPAQYREPVVQEIIEVE